MMLPAIAAIPRCTWEGGHQFVYASTNDWVFGRQEPPWWVPCCWCGTLLGPVPEVEQGS